MKQNFYIVLKRFFQEAIQKKLAELLNHLYFQELKSSINSTIIIIFFVQRINLLLSSDQKYGLKEQEIYFDVCQLIFSWVTLQKPLQMLGSESLNIMLSGFYILVDTTMLLIFCFSLFKWRFISKFFSTYITYFQLFILFQTQIHYLSQEYSFKVNFLISIPKYFNYFIIVYCTRNYFILSQQHMLKRYSIYNFLIMITDYVTFLLYNVLDQYARNYLLFLLFIVYFVDSFFYQPYCKKMNILYVLATISLVNSTLVKICMKNFQISEQIYIFFLLNPLISAVFVQLSNANQELLFSSSISIELFIYLGETMNHPSLNLILNIIDKQRIKKLCQAEELNAKSIQKLLVKYQELIKTKVLNKQYNYLYVQNQLEDILLYNMFLSYKITGSYLLCLLQVKQFQIQNKNHSTFFQVISRLITQKYYDQINFFYKTEIKQVQNNHQRLFGAREFQTFYISNIQDIQEVLDQKIKIWNQILLGFNFIDDALNQVLQLHKLVFQLSKKHQQLTNQKKLKFNHNQLINYDILTLRYFSFYYSYIESDFITSFKIEKQIEEIMIEEKSKTSSQSINIQLLKGNIIIIGASILQNKGEIIYGGATELIKFFSLDSQVSNVNNLMPQFIAQNHNNYIDRFIQKGESEYFTTNKLVFGQDGQGYAVPLELSFLHFQQKTEDFILTAFIKKVSPSLESIIFSKNGNILGISKIIYQLITGQISNEQTQQIDLKIFDSFVQFWIPNIFELLEARKKNNQKNNKKEIIQLFMMKESLSLYDILKSQTITREKISTLNEIDQNFEQQKLISSNQINSNIQQIFLEVSINEIIMPQGQIIYYIEFQSLKNDFTLFNQDELTPELFSEKQQYQLKNKFFDYFEGFHQSKISVELQSKSKLLKKNEEVKKSKQESHCQNMISLGLELQNEDLNSQIRVNILNYQTLSQSSHESTNSNFQVYEVLKQIQKKKGINKNVIKIFISNLILYLTLILFSSVILKIFNSQNEQLSHNLQLIRYPDRFNRLYCSFTTMGQLDLERSLQILTLDQYQIYRIQRLSNEFRKEMQEMMSNLRIQFSILDSQGKLSVSNIRMMNYFDYFEEKMSLIQFNLQVEAIAYDLCQKILSGLEYFNESKIQIMNQYFALQFLKGNLINQIESSQSLIDDVISEILYSNFTFLESLYILLIIQLVLILFHSILTTYVWRESYQATKQILQLITYPSDQSIYISIQKAMEGQQFIKSINWKYINYFRANFNNDQLRQSKIDETNFVPLKNKSKQAVRFRIINTSFNFKIVYLQIFFLTFLMFGVIVGCYIYLTSISNSSLPEIQLTMEYVQFKQDWDSLMILSFLLKTNIDLTQKALELGFLEKNQYLKDQNQYFHTVYIEMLQRFSETVLQASQFNVNIFSHIVNSNRMLKSDQLKLLDLYENDLCIVLERELPFCNLQNGKFTNYPDYPTPNAENNNREIFKQGINGIFQKILQIFQQQYHLELLNQQNHNISETKLFIQSQDFQFYIEQYFFDINKAVVEFYKTILQSIVNILELDFQNIIFFNVFTIIIIFLIHLLVLISYLYQLEHITKACKIALTLLPQECLTENKCLMILKKIRKDI